MDCVNGESDRVEVVSVGLKCDEGERGSLRASVAQWQHARISCDEWKRNSA